MSRAGNPCAAGSGSPFIRTAIIASRWCSVTQAVGKPAVNPSTEKPTSWVAPGWIPAMSRTSVSRTPVHDALPTRCPPTSLLTQAIVTQRSMSGIETSSANVSATSRSTIPVTVSFHVDRSTWGVISAVSIR